VASATVASRTQTGKGITARPKTVKIIWKCDEKAENLRVETGTGKADPIDKIVEKLGTRRGSYVMEMRDGNGKLRMEYKIAEGWTYRIYRTSPPGTQQEGYEEMKRRGNQTRPLLNRSSWTAWG
jgi:hypothetical protein